MVCLKKLAIISSYHETCGIATYTERLEPVFRNYYEVDVLRLDTEILKSDNKELIALGNSLIDDLAKQAKGYDFVNIQFEAGLYGFSPEIVANRIGRILNCCSNVIFTFHSVNFNTPRLSKSALLSRHFFRVLKDYRDAKKWPKFYDGLIKKLKAMDSTSGKQANIIVHDKKTQRFVSRLYHFEHIYAHPLCLSSEAERSTSRTAEEKAEFNRTYAIHPSKKTIGIFGFISEYKGHMVALQALRHLPDNYQLLIFGAQHPASIQAFVPVEAYINRLLTYIDECDQADVKKKTAKGDGKQNAPEVPSVIFSQRVHFLGNVSDDDFARAMRCCDVVILPYVEVNQMGSGIAALALECHANAIFSNTKCFQELQEFFPNTFDVVDIGNYIQLAHKIEQYSSNYDAEIDAALCKYNLEKNVQLYVDIFERG